MIIGICGLIGAGKDTIADYLVNIHEFRRDSFAGALKDAVAAVFGWDRMMLEGRTKHSREWREQIDPWWSQRLGMTITPRWVLQYWGTEVGRQAFHNEIWIASLENKLRQNLDDVVISDCRFPNEIQGIRRAGGRVIWVRRGPLPEWYDVAYQQNLQATTAHTMECAYPEVHASEWSWIGTDFDSVIDNDGTLEDLYDQINDLVLGLQLATVDHSETMPLNS